MIDVTVSPTLASVVQPVLREMAGGPLREALMSGFGEEKDALQTIEEAFDLLTSKKHDPEDLKRFFKAGHRLTTLPLAPQGSAAG
jgi:hypothetical protein